jgi:hypothetical protein
MIGLKPGEEEEEEEGEELYVILSVTTARQWIRMHLGIVFAVHFFFFSSLWNWKLLLMIVLQIARKWKTGV